MSETSVIAILASVGIILTGTVTAEASVLAKAIVQNEPAALVEFLRQYPESPLAPEALMLASEVMADRTDDAAASEDNPALACSLHITRLADGKAQVSWEATGAVEMALHPLGFKKGEIIPAVGEKVIDVEDFIRVGLTARDADGNEVACSVVLHTTQIDNSGNSGDHSGPGLIVSL